MVLHIFSFTVYESSGKYPEGLFGSGNLQAVGLFDECLDVEAQSFNDTATGYFISTVFLCKIF